MLINNLLFTLCVVFCTWALYSSIRRGFNAGTLSLAIFSLIYVYPLGIEIFCGHHALDKYYGFKVALDDQETTLLYVLFVFIVLFVYYRYIKGKPLVEYKLNRSKIITLRKKIATKKNLVVFAYIFPIFVAITFFASPNFTDFLKLGYVSTNRTLYTNSELRYFDILKYLNYLNIFALEIIKLSDTKKSYFSLFYRLLIIIMIALINGKRTLLAFVVTSVLAIDLLSYGWKKKLIAKILLICGLFVAYFMIYANISGKIAYSSTLYAMISEYFFRGNSVRVAIYSALNPDKLKILDYPFQTYIYDAFFFIPRKIWSSKPLAYPDYYSSAIHGFSSFTFIGWYFLTGCYAECVSNLGLIGLFVGPFLFIKLCKIIDDSKSTVANYIGMFFMAVIQVFEYSDMFKIIFIVEIILLIWARFIKGRIRLK